MFKRASLNIISCYMPNIETIIKGHNSSILKESNIAPKTCNCRSKINYPLNDNCSESCIVSKAEVVTENQSKIHFDFCNGFFKERLRNHTKPLNKENTDTKYIWTTTEKCRNFSVPSLKKCHPYRVGNRRCDL